MTRMLSRLSRVLALTVVAGLLAGPASAQTAMRFVTGSFNSYWNRYDPPGLTTTVTTIGGRQCGPNQTAMDPCQGQRYPFVAGVNVAPVSTLGPGALQQADIAVGGDVNMPFAAQWTRTASGMIPAGFIPGVLSIWTIFDGRNDVALPATGKGLASGQGPGNFVYNPLAAAIPGSTMFQTIAFLSGMDPGQTTSPGVFVSTNFPSMPANPNHGATYTAGPRQFGGTAGVLSDTPNRLTLDFVTAIYQRTNGKCRAGLPFGDCQVGFAWGTDRRATSVRRHVNTANPSIVLGQHGYWQGYLWTTGTLSVMDGQMGDSEEWFALSGTDEITPSGARHLVLVSPVLNYDRNLFGVPGGSPHIAVWDMLIPTPEPTAALGLLAGLGLIGGLHVRARRRG